MSKYIEAEVFKAKIMNYGIIHEGDHIPIPFYKEHCGKMFTELLRWVCEEVDDALPADVAEVKHGRWEEHIINNIYCEGGVAIRLTCPVCGECFTVTREARPRERFCRWCGAKMDEVEDNG